MTDSPPPNHFRRVQGPLTTGDVVILTIITTALLAVIVFGGVSLWHTLEPGPLDSTAWTAVGALGAWFAAVPTALAVVVAVRQSRHAREDAEKARKAAEDLQSKAVRREAWRADIAATLALLEPLEAFRTAMREADSQADTYRKAYDDPEAQCNFEEEDGAFLKRHSHAIGSFTATATAEYLRVRSAAIQVTSPDLRPSLDEACKVISLLGKQIDTWSLDARNGVELRDVTTGITEMGLDMGADTGALGVLARRALAVVRDAAASSKGVDIWSDEDDATVDQ